MKQLSVLTLALFLATGAAALLQAGDKPDAPAQQASEQSECRKMPGAAVSEDARERKGKPAAPPGETASERARDRGASCGIGALPQDD